MSLLTPPPLSTLPVLPGAELRRPDAAPATPKVGAALLRAEVEPQARGLSIDAHAARVLEALLAPR